MLRIINGSCGDSGAIRSPGGAGLRILAFHDEPLLSNKSETNGREPMIIVGVNHHFQFFGKTRILRSHREEYGIQVDLNDHLEYDIHIEPLPIY